jgi:hypothetical protein
MNSDTLKKCARLPDTTVVIRVNRCMVCGALCRLHLKGLSHDFKNVVENGQVLALTRAAAGF